MMTARDVVEIARTNPDHAWHLLRTVAWQPQAREAIREALKGTAPPPVDAPRTAKDRWAQAGFTPPHLK